MQEDSSRLHYEAWELRIFENIECQWPLFFCYLVINGIFTGDDDMTEKYSRALERLLVHTSRGSRMVPELYAVPLENVNDELANPGSQEFKTKGRVPFMWAQSLYVVGQLLRESFVACGELDPINRRLSPQAKPEVVVQVVVMAKNKDVKQLLANHGYHVKTISELEAIEVHPARVLSHLYTFLGK